MHSFVVSNMHCGSVVAGRGCIYSRMGAPPASLPVPLVATVEASVPLLGTPSVGSPPTHAGWTSSPLTEQMYIPSSSVTFRQFHPSEANSTAFRSAFSCNSYRLDQMRDFIRLLYSWRVGMGMTSTWSSKAIFVVLGFNFVFDLERGSLVVSPLPTSFSSSLSSGTTMDSSSQSSSSSLKPDLSGSLDGTNPLRGCLVAEPSGGDWWNILYPTPIPRRMRTRRCCAAVSGCDCI